MAETKTKQEKMNAIVARLRETFLHELPDRVSDLESMVLALENGDDFVQTYETFFRNVHSLKGRGGTYSLPVITTICHQIEDLLKDVGATETHLAKNYSDRLLQYVDLLSSITERYDSGDSELRSIEAALASLQQQAFAGLCRCLIVDSSATTRELCALSLSNEKVDLSYADSGMEALERLLNEEFDLLITGMAIGNLNGKALIAALKLSDSNNAKMPTILLTTSDISRPEAHLEADRIVVKGPDMPKNLAAVKRELLQHGSGTA